MADDIEITAGSGTPVKTDEVGGKHYQLVKLVDGTAESETRIASGEGVKANAMRVALPTDAADVKVTLDGEAVTANLGATDNAVLDAIQAAVEKLDDAVAGTEIRVDVVSSALPSGAATEATLAAVDGHVGGIEGLLGTIDADTSGLAGCVAGTEMQVDVVSAPAVRALTNADVVTAELSAVDNAVLDTIDADTSALAGCVAGTEIQVDVVSSALPTGAATDATLTDIHGHVDGIEGVLATIDADTGALAGCVGGTELQVDVVGALPAGSNAIGKLAANDGVDIGNVDVASIAAGDNNIGNVDVVTMPTVELKASAAAIGKLAANSGVDIGDVDVLTCGAVSPGTAAANLGKAEDAAHSSGDVGVMALAIRDDTIGAMSGAEGDYEPLHTDATGRLYTNSQGPAAHDAAAAGNPLLLGAEALSAERAAVATTDVTKLVADLVGKLVTLPYAIPELFVKGKTAAITDTTRTPVIAAQGAGVKLYITHIAVTNSHATVGTYVKIESATTEIYGGYAAAAGGGFSYTLPVPLALGANEALNVSCGTTGANVYACASGYKGA